MSKNQKGFALFPIVIAIIMLGIVGYAVYKNLQSKQSVVLPLPMGRESENDGKTPPIGKVDEDKTDINKCSEAIYEIARQTCVSETGFDPDFENGESRPGGDSITEKENSSSTDFWVCHEKISIEEEAKCQELYPDTVELRSQYYKCLSEKEDVLTNCGKTTGYTAVNEFPENIHDIYRDCIDAASEKQVVECQSQTGFAP